jgi:hypothetical protein
MSIASEISRLQTAKAGLKTAIEGKGVSVPSATTLDGYPALVNAIPTGQVEDEYTWTRPATWFDLDALNMTGFDGMYMTYDLSEFQNEDAYISVCCELSDNGKFVIERGHITNNTFVADASYESNHRTPFKRILDVEDGMLQLWRITGKTGLIRRGGFCANQFASGSVLAAGYQPCVESYVQMPNINSSGSSANDVIESYVRVCPVTYFTQHVKMMGTYGSMPSNAFAFFFRYAASLQLIDFKNAVFTNVTSLNVCCNPTRHLKFLDLRGATFPSVTVPGSIWYGSGVKKVDFSSLNGANITSWSRIAENNEDTREIYPCAIAADFSANAWSNLSKASLLRIINALVETETTLTLTLGTGNKPKLTSEEIAVATAKGWTVA